MKIYKLFNSSFRALGFAGWMLLAFIGIWAVRANYDASVLQEQSCSTRYPEFTLSRHLSGIDSQQVEARFPYRHYVDSATWCDPGAIMSDLALLDSLYPGQNRLHRQIITRALTDTLEHQLAPALATWHPDTLTGLLHWALRFGHYQDIDTENAKIYRIVHRFWFNKVSNLLGQYTEQDANVKYEFKFKYLASVCHTQKFTPPVGRSKLEKVIDNVINQKFSYLFNRFWHGTKWYFKAIALLGVAFLFYSIYAIYKVNIK